MKDKSMLKIKSTIGAVLVATLFLSLFNVAVIFQLRAHPRLDTVKGLRVREDGHVELDLAGILLPADAPTDTFLKDPVINKHDYSYIHNPSGLCFNRTVNLLVGVVSTPKNFWERKRGRRFGNAGDGILVVFILGMADSSSLQRRVNQESKHHNDVLQSAIIETPRNLSLKTVALLKWTSAHCSNAKFVLKKDDDVELDPYSILSALRHKHERYHNFIMGNSKYLVEGPIRQEVSKYYTSYAEYGEPFFPMFAHGPAYGFPMLTSDILYQVTLRTKLFWLEDVYITGICAQRANIPVFFDIRFIYEHKIIKQEKDFFCYKHCFIQAYSGSSSGTYKMKQVMSCLVLL
ncbi:hypothetical protein Btru_027529 [Bulinus truncatus]|nr:hypothetical protein Btru_027529 [Bulinus truncatus]